MSHSDNPQDAPDSMLEHRIRQRAQEIYLRRLKDPALFDWLQAEAEIRAETGCSELTRSFTASKTV